MTRCDHVTVPLLQVTLPPPESANEALNVSYSVGPVAPVAPAPPALPLVPAAPVTP